MHKLGENKRNIICIIIIATLSISIGIGVGLYITRNVGCEIRQSAHKVVVDERFNIFYSN